VILLFAFSDTPKCNFPIFENETTGISVKSNEQSAKYHGYKWCSKCPPSAFTHSRSRVRYWPCSFDKRTNEPFISGSTAPQQQEQPP